MSGLFPDSGSTAWHTLSAVQLAQELQTDLTSGLTPDEVQARLVTCGPNALPESAPPAPIGLFLRQFSSLIVWVLVGAAVVAGLLGEWVDTAAIIAIVLLNAILGFVQEYRAERSLAALKKLALTNAKVLRGGKLLSLPSTDLAPGDVMMVEAGDHVPADARLLYASSLRTQEAALTGESTPVEKTDDVLTTAVLPVVEKKNCLFWGTDIVAGKGRAVVVATGVRTELGRIAVLMQHEERESTPLQQRLTQLGRVLLVLSLGIVGVVFILGIRRGEPLVNMFLTAVSLAVAAIPEGLPAIVTMTLAIGVTKMVKRHALIRQLPAVETLGSTTVICTDKTGTLTKNEMTVTRIFIDGHTLAVSGEGYAPVGEIREEGQILTGDLSGGVQVLLEAAVLCNDASLAHEEQKWVVVGDPTEGALLVVAAKVGVTKAALAATQSLLGEAPFDAERKRMTVVRDSSDGPVAYVKGAPDSLLPECSRYRTLTGKVEPLTDDVCQQIVMANSLFAQHALRVLGIAVRPLMSLPSTFQAQELERDLIFLGLVAMKDPLRTEAKIAAATCRDAGIRTVMITGDHKDTAIAIARELGILGSGMQALAGVELDELSDEALAKQAPATAVYARVTAAHKLRVVKAWQSHGAVVAMTGDGVNDAPAVKAANIGIAMGITGTDVTKEAAAMVVTDDNFASIAAAVEEGRAIYANIRKAVYYLLSCNLSEIFLMLLATLLFLPLPLLPVHILWINLVTDGLPALALAVDPHEPDLMRRPPRPPHAPLLSPRRLLALSGQGLFMAVVALAAFLFFLYREDRNLHEARTAAFTVLVFAQLIHAFNCRSASHSLFSLGVGTNPMLLGAVLGSIALQITISFVPLTQTLFVLAPFDPTLWLVACGLGMLPLPVMEAVKIGLRWQGKTRIGRLPSCDKPAS